MRRCPIFVLIYFSILFLTISYIRPGQVFRKTCLVDLSRVAVVGMKSDWWRYWASSGLVAWSRMLFVTTSYCCVSRGNSHIPVCLFLTNFIIPCPLFGRTFLACLVCLCIHHHIRLPMILVGILPFLEFLNLPRLFAYACYLEGHCMWWLHCAPIYQSFCHVIWNYDWSHCCGGLFF